MLRNFLNSYFGFNKQQRNGLVVLVLVSLALLVIRLLYPLFIVPANIVLLELPLIERKIDSSYYALRTYSKSSSYDKKKSENTEQLFAFDPNLVSAEQLLKLGFKEKSVKIFLKFRAGGFVFKQKEDLRKVYGISEKFYNRLEPYIVIAVPEITKNKAKDELPPATAKPGVKQAAVKLELNSADSLSLVALSGIGPGFAKRILKFRALLGGFTHIEQLKEVYGFSEELFEKIKNSVYVDAGAIRKLNLNKDEFKVLNKHPYLSYEITRSIFDWRRKTTINVTNLKDIINDPALYEKLLPYLVFE